MVLLYSLYLILLSVRAAMVALEKLNHTPLNGKPIRVMWSVRHREARNTVIGNLFVKVELKESCFDLYNNLYVFMITPVSFLVFWNLIWAFLIVSRTLATLLTMGSSMRCFQNSEPFYLVKLLQMRVGRARGLGSFNSIPKNQQILQLKISMTPFSMEKQCKKQCSN